MLDMLESLVSRTGLRFLDLMKTAVCRLENKFKRLSSEVHVQ